jgi:hypothetical protein
VRRPERLALLSTLLLTGGCLLLLPVARLQVELWAVAAVTFVGGDTLTTARLSRAGLAERGRFTRAVCGRRPSLGCALGTRLVVFGGFALVWAGGRWLAGGVAALGTALTVLPVVLAAGGLFATGWNLSVWRASR